MAASSLCYFATHWRDIPWTVWCLGSFPTTNMVQWLGHIVSFIFLWLKCFSFQRFIKGKCAVSTSPCPQFPSLSTCGSPQSIRKVDLSNLDCSYMKMPLRVAARGFFPIRFHQMPSWWTHSYMAWCLINVSIFPWNIWPFWATALISLSILIQGLSLLRMPRKDFSSDDFWWTPSGCCFDVLIRVIVPLSRGEMGTCSTSQLHFGQVKVNNGCIPVWIWTDLLRKMPYKLKFANYFLSSSNLFIF